MSTPKYRYGVYLNLDVVVFKYAFLPWIITYCFHWKTFSITLIIFNTRCPTYTKFNMRGLSEALRISILPSVIKSFGWCVLRPCRVKIKCTYALTF